MDAATSILPLLPLILRSGSFYWPPTTLSSLKSLALGPDVSGVASGSVLFDAILDLRESLGLASDRLVSRAADGYELFFDELMSRMDALAWFGDVVPELARLLMRLPALLDAHYRGTDRCLRLLRQQEAGVVFLSQELIGALLACALFCLFPSSPRAGINLSDINFDYLFAETNKAFCGFYDCSKYQRYLQILKHVEFCKNQFHHTDHKVMNHDASDPFETVDNSDSVKNTHCENYEADCRDSVGVATGNWGCGAFGGDPEIKSIIQWIAASQALRPFIHYYTFEQAALQKLDQVTQWIMVHKWTVGDLWCMLVEYSSQKLNRETNVGFLSWLLPEDDTSSAVDYMCE